VLTANLSGLPENQPQQYRTTDPPDEQKQFNDNRLAPITLAAIRVHAGMSLERELQTLRGASVYPWSNVILHLPNQITLADKQNHVPG
jgi:hypothetical protein